MNALLRPEHIPMTTQAAEGLPRRRFSVAEIEAMVRAEVIGEGERFELIGGVVARIGSTVYDGSIRGQLRELKQRLTGVAF